MITKDRIRDLFHIILGISPGYLVYSLLIVENFTKESLVFGVCLLSALFGVIINGVFNWTQGKLFNINSKSYELLLGSNGGLFGGILAIFLPNVFWAWTLFISCIVICIWDLLRTKKQ